MSFAEKEINWTDQTWLLLSDKAIYWPKQNALLVSDLHLGKDASFRKEGVPVPDGALEEDLKRLELLINSYQANTLYILGDLVHNRFSISPYVLSTFHAWRNTVNLPIILIEGNHDQYIDSFPKVWNLEVVKESIIVDGVRLSHDSDNMFKEPVICGHVHPVYELRASHDVLVLPCFCVSPQRMILPSFGSLTGGHRISRRKSESLYVPTPSKIIEVLS